jgi:hypothetical protein
MTAALLVVLAACGAVALLGTAMCAVARRTDRLADQVHTAVWGTDANGRPRPSCTACLYPDADRPEGLEHVPGCWAHVPDSPAELTEGDDR